MKTFVNPQQQIKIKIKQLHLQLYYLRYSFISLKFVYLCSKVQLDDYLISFEIIKILGISASSQRCYVAMELPCVNQVLESLVVSKALERQVANLGRLLRLHLCGNTVAAADSKLAEAKLSSCSSSFIHSLLQRSNSFPSCSKRLNALR